jgi:hypothetical protein
VFTLLLLFLVVVVAIVVAIRIVAAAALVVADVVVFDAILGAVCDGYVASLCLASTVFFQHRLHEGGQTLLVQ